MTPRGYSARDNAFYAAQLCFMRFHPESEIQVIQSKDNRRSLDPLPASARSVITNFDDNLGDSTVAVLDKELLAIDNNPSSPFYGRLYSRTSSSLQPGPDGFSDYCPVQLAYPDEVDPNNDTDLQDNRGATPPWSRTIR